MVIPGSFCPACRRELRWYEIFPVLSFVALSGRCKGCHKPIALRDTIVELLSGAVFVLIFIFTGISLRAVVEGAFFLLMLIIGFIDWENLIIPNGLVLVGIVVGVIAIGFLSFQSVWYSITYAAFSAGVLFLFRIMGDFCFGKETMGMGDVKLAALVGFFLGLANFLIAVWFAALLSCLYWVTMYFRKDITGDFKIPFGSFLSWTSIVISLIPPADNAMLSLVDPKAIPHLLGLHL